MLMEAISQGEALLSNWASSPSLSYGQSGVSLVLWNLPSWVLRVYAPSIIPNFSSSFSFSPVLIPFHQKLFPINVQFIGQ